MMPRRARREVVDVAEPRRQDDSLGKLLHVRKQRLGRLERERNEARQRWRAQRETLRAKKVERRRLLAETAAFWQEARAAFFAMTSTTGQFGAAKARYEKMKEEAAVSYLRWREELGRCHAAQRAFFDALDAVRAAQRQQEKLGILRDELREQARRAEE